MNKTLAAAASDLVRIVEEQLADDLPHAPAWLGPEGERVLDNAKAFLESARRKSEAKLLAGTSLAHYLGEGWVGCHSEVYDQVKIIERLLRGHRT